MPNNTNTAVIISNNETDGDASHLNSAVAFIFVHESDSILTNAQYLAADFYPGLWRWHIDDSGCNLHSVASPC